MAYRLALSAFLLGLLCGAPFASATGGPAGGIVINEILYDPDGPDEGWEFVELMNTGGGPVSLEGWSLWSGNGARPESWSAAWRGTPADSLGPGELFLVAGASVPGADAYAKLALQNGPDGCALVLDGARVDVVGWGSHEFSEYYEGAPAPDVSSGTSLARVPDGRDTGDNSADFVALSAPTPGGMNALPTDMAFVGRGVQVNPPNPEVMERVSVLAQVANVGYGTGNKEQFTLNLDVLNGASGSWAPLDRIPSALSAGDTAVIETVWEPARAGPFIIEALIHLAGDLNAGNDSASAGIRVGPGPLIVNEIMYDPGLGGEWIELLNTCSDTIDTRGWRVTDRSGGALEIRSHRTVPPGGHAVLAEDSAALVDLYGGIDTAKVIGTYRGRWTALNNTDAADGIADAITIVDADGMPSDVSEYSRRFGGGAGVSLERLRPDLIGRRPDNWHSSIAPCGATPGTENSAGSGAWAGDGLLNVSPALVSGGKGRVSTISYALPFRPSKLRISLYSMDGRELAVLADRRNGPMRGSLLWSACGATGDPLPRGAYILLLSGQGEAGQTARAKAVVAVR